MLRLLLCFRKMMNFCKHLSRTKAPLWEAYVLIVTCRVPCKSELLCSNDYFNDSYHFNLSIPRRECTDGRCSECTDGRCSSIVFYPIVVYTNLILIKCSTRQNYETQLSNRDSCSMSKGKLQSCWARNYSSFILKQVSSQLFLNRKFISI